MRTNTNLSASKCKCFQGPCTLNVSFNRVFYGLHENGKAKCKERQVWPAQFPSEESSTLSES